MSVVLASVTPIAVRLRARDARHGSAGPPAGSSRSRPPAASSGRSRPPSGSSPSYGTDQVLAFGAVVLLAAAAGRRAASSAAGVAGGRPRDGRRSRARRRRARARAPPATCSQARRQELVARSTGERERARRATATLPSRTRRRASPSARRATARYHRLVVVEDDESRYLRFDSSFQSGMYVTSSRSGRGSRTPTTSSSALAYHPDAKNGSSSSASAAASAPKRVWRDFPAIARDQVVELDPDVVDAAYRWFALPRDRRLAVEVDDGRRYLQRTTERYDVIMLDAFYSDGVPFHLTTLEFMRASPRPARRRAGSSSANVIGALKRRRSRSITRALWKTYASVFPSVARPPGRRGACDRRRRRSATSSSSPRRERAEPRRLAAARGPTSRQERERQGADLAPRCATAGSATSRSRDVPLLTDDYAPTDALLIV